MGVHKTNTNHLLNTLNQDLNSKKPECFRERSKRKKQQKGKPHLQEVLRPPHYYQPWTELAFSLWAEGVILKRAEKRDPHAPCHNLRSDQRLRAPPASTMPTREDPLRPSQLRTERPLPPEPTSAGGPSWEATMQCPRPRTRWQAQRPRASCAGATSPRPPRCKRGAPEAPAMPCPPCPATPALRPLRARRPRSTRGPHLGGESGGCA